MKASVSAIQQTDLQIDWELMRVTGASLMRKKQRIGTLSASF